MANHSGVDGDVNLGALALCVTSWSFSDSVNALDTTTKCSSGFTNKTAGLRSGSGSADFVHDDAIHDAATNPVKAGTTATAVFELWDGGNSVTAPILITSYNLDTPVDGIVTGSIDFETNGVYYMPGESTS